MAGAWQVRGSTGTGFYSVLNSIFALGADHASFTFKKVQRWQMAAGCLLLKLVLSCPSELGPDLSSIVVVQ
jgi:hypothetical protein